ncbi:hypothetical protein [Hymenobacter sp. DG01]|uniref:hypothetical protein n=1 Tax=Hymenobacter sp. DG01 TaxID=2584940 RepID=UPI0027E297A7|nr:hypothetical protein [Hymenobacter sp. DG01]
MVQIFDIHLRPLQEQLKRQGITLELTPEARSYLALLGFTPRYGARPIKGVIRQQLRRPISRMIIAGEVGKGSVISLDKLPDAEDLTWHMEATKELAEQPDVAAPIG